MRNDGKGLGSHMRREGCIRLWQGCAKVLTTLWQDCTTQSQPCRRIKLKSTMNTDTWVWDYI